MKGLTKTDLINLLIGVRRGFLLGLTGAVIGFIISIPMSR